MDSSNAQPITTAVNAVFLKFISWVTAADERAIGVDAGLNTGILSFTFVHICTKPKCITISVTKKTKQTSRQTTTHTNEADT